jgi:hypothetical protein
VRATNEHTQPNSTDCDFTRIERLEKISDLVGEFQIGEALGMTSHFVYRDLLSRESVLVHKTRWTQNLATVYSP